MTTDVSIAEVGALVGDRRRAAMLAALLDGRALTATELACVAGVSAATASGHLGKLTRGGLLALTSRGRHRYFRLASPGVAILLEKMMVVAATLQFREESFIRIDPSLREARTCYDHLAGRLGVALADALVIRGALVLTEEAGEISAHGRTLLRSFEIPVDPPRRTRRPYCRPCLDWSERRLHIAGFLGAALLDRCLELGWLKRAPEGRAIAVTATGRRGIAEKFGVRF